MPGLVNAHTHLEFSDLEAPLGPAGLAFTDWIELVVRHRQMMAEREDWPNSKSLAIAKGLNESAAAGVSLIGEISTQPVCATAYDTSHVEVVAFLERLGRDDSQLQQKLQSLETDCAAFRQPSIQMGISPHAPYSVSDRLLDGLLAWAASKRLPIAMHLAESEAELSLLKKGTGAFIDLLKKLNAWFPDSYTKKSRPLDYLQKLAKMKSSLLIHGNFFSADELDFVAQHRDRMTPVFCPRTHQFFENGRYPLLQMLDRGIDVAVGTDSRASNPDLCVLSELKTIHRLFPEISAGTVVPWARSMARPHLVWQARMAHWRQVKRRHFAWLRLIGRLRLITSTRRFSVARQIC